MLQDKSEEVEEGRKLEERREGGGEDDLGRGTTFSWSRALTLPQKCNRMRHMVIRGREVMP